MSYKDIVTAVRKADEFRSELPPNLSSVSDQQAQEFLSKYKKSIKPFLKTLTKNELIDLCSKSRIEVAILQHILETKTKAELPKEPSSEK